MSNVIEFPKREEKKEERIVWECLCGCQRFYLHYDQSVECAECGKFSAEMKCFDSTAH